MWNLKTNKQTQAHRYREQIGVARGVGWGVGEMGEGGQKGKRETSFVTD